MVAVEPTVVGVVNAVVVVVAFVDFPGVEGLTLVVGVTVGVLSS